MMLWTPCGLCRHLLIPLFLLALIPAVLSAQDDGMLRRGVTTEGKEFWVVFQKNFRDYNKDDITLALSPAPELELELFITSSRDATGFVEVRGIGFRRDFTCKAGEVIAIRVDSAAQLRTSETIEDLAVHIVSNEPIAVYGLSHRWQTTDTYLAYPVSVLGRSYRIMGYRWLADDLLSQFAIVATQDETEVTITPTVRTKAGKPAGKPFTIELDRGEVYQVIPAFNPATSSADLTGSLIESDKPIAVFSGHNCAYVPENTTKACNILVEQMPPLQSWGRQFYVGTLAGRSSSVIRILAAEDGTEVFLNNRKVTTLAAGQHYENPNLIEHTMVTSSKPILVSQYSKGYAAVGANGAQADSVGDPMMIVVAPTEQFLNNYRFATPVQGSWEHYINVIAPTSTIETLRLNGQPIDRRKFNQLGISRYSIAQVKIPYGTYTISAQEPFGLYSYGFGFADMVYDAYGNGGGQSMIQLVDAPDTLAPTLDASNNLDFSAIIGIVRDDRLNDEGIKSVEALEAVNVNVEVDRFEIGSPQATARMRPIITGQDASARFRLTDRAGNVADKLVCMKYDEFGDSLMITVLEGHESCSFKQPIYFGGYFNYSAVDNHVEIAAGDEFLGNPVQLDGNFGVPSYGVGAIGDYAWSAKITLTGRLGLDFQNGDAYGYWPDSAEPVADDGTPIHEEFRLNRNTAFLTLAPGVRWFPLDATSYVFGSLAIGIPINVSETYSRQVLNPSNFVYENGENVNVLYEGDGPSGLGLLLAPEAGIGANLRVDKKLWVFGELGASFALFSVSPDRDWGRSWLFGRIGAKTVIEW